MAKVSKVRAVYIGPTLVPTRGTSCDRCRDFIARTSECVITDPPAVNGPRGTCTQFLPGTAPDSAGPLRIVPQSVVGYIEGPDVPTFCGRCGYYEHPDRLQSTCRGVEGIVDFHGCCNFYEAR